MQLLLMGWIAVKLHPPTMHARMQPACIVNGCCSYALLRLFLRTAHIACAKPPCLHAAPMHRAASQQRLHRMRSCRVLKEHAPHALRSAYVRCNMLHEHLC